MVMDNPRSSYDNTGSTRVPDAVYQVSRSSAFWFQRRKIFKFWAWSCDLDHLNKFSFPKSHGGAIWNLVSIGLAVSEQKNRVQARERLRRNTRPDGVNFALEGSGGEKTSSDICSFCKKSLLLLPLYWKQNENICHKWTWNFQITWQNTFKRCNDYFGV